MKVGELFALLKLDKSHFDRGIASAGAGMGRLGGIAKGAGKAIAAGLAVGVAAVAAVGAAALDNAVEQERANKRVEQAYGSSADAVNTWAMENSRAMGVNDDVLQMAMARYGDFARNIGMSTDDAIATGQQLATRAEEIARATGAPFDEVFDKLMKGAQGATRGLREYGVAIGPVELQNKALELGIWNGKGALTAQQKSLASTALMMEQTAQFTDTAAQSTDDLAYKQRQMGVIVDEVMDFIGAAVLNVATAVMPVIIEAFSAFSAWVMENGPLIQGIFDTVFTALFAVITDFVLPALSALGQLLMWAGEVVVPIIASAIQWISDNVLPALTEAFNAVVTWVSANWPTISRIVGAVANAVQIAFNVIAAVIKFVWPIVEAVAKVLFPIVGAAASALLTVIDGAFKTIGDIWQTAADVAKTIVEAISTAFDGLKGFFTGLWDAIGGAFRGGINVVIDLINGLIRFLNGIRIEIPEIGIPGTDIKVGGGAIDPFNIPTIPRLARGTEFFKGGLALVGERGPELVSMPRGSRVWPNGEGPGFGGKVTVEIRDPDGAVGRGGYDQGQIERVLERALTETIGGARHRSLRTGASS